MIFQPSAPRHETERMIYKNRDRDAQNGQLQTKLKQEFYEKEFARFENKGQIVSKQKYIQKRLQEFRYQARMELNQRRAKLAQLLDSEHEQHKQEIKDLEETPEQIRQKMTERVKFLKNEKEAARKQYVEEQLERRFKQNADELRKVDQEYNELKALQERNIQMMEKQKLLQDQYEEEMIYAQLYKRDIAKKERQDRQKMKEAMEKLQERNQVLARQLELNNQKREDLNNQVKDERAMLNEEWRAEDERHQNQLKEQKQFLQTLNKDIRLTNDDQQHRKQVSKQIEKQQDKQWVNGIVQKEKMLDQLENEQKRKNQQETINFMKNQAERSNEAEIFEKEAEKLIAIESEKQYQRQKAKWDAEEQARIKLMYDVYGDRHQSVIQKQQYSQLEKQEKEVEKDILNRAVQEFEEEEEKKRIREMHNNKSHQRSLLNQVDDKQQRFRNMLNQKHYEEEEERRRQLEYEAKIQAQKEKGKQLLEELRKQRPF